MTWDNTFALTEGVHTLYVEAWDNANNHVSSSVTFRVDHCPSRFDHLSGHGILFQLVDRIGRLDRYR